MKRYWVTRRESEQGPYGTEELRMMTITGEIQSSDKIRIADVRELLPAREVLRNKPSMLQREWAQEQSRQAGFAARCLLVSAVVPWGVPVLKEMTWWISSAALVLAIFMILVQLGKGSKKPAFFNLGLAFILTPFLCWSIARLVS